MKSIAAQTKLILAVCLLVFAVAACRSSNYELGEEELSANSNNGDETLCSPLNPCYEDNNGDNDGNDNSSSATSSKQSTRRSSKNNLGSTPASNQFVASKRSDCDRIGCWVGDNSQRADTLTEWDKDGDKCLNKKEAEAFTHELCLTEKRSKAAVCPKDENLKPIKGAWVVFCNFVDVSTCVCKQTTARAYCYAPQGAKGRC